MPLILGDGLSSVQFDGPCAIYSTERWCGVKGVCVIISVSLVDRGAEGTADPTGIALVDVPLLRMRYPNAITMAISTVHKGTVIAPIMIMGAPLVAHVTAVGDGDTEGDVEEGSGSVTMSESPLYIR